jgi:transcriptional regulator with XRE-family HTH domain
MQLANHTGMPRTLPKLFKPLHVGEWISRSGRPPREIAEAIGVTEAYLSELISGRKKNPSALVLLALSEELKITVNDLYRRPPTAAEMERLKDLTPAQAALLGQLLDQAKGGR